ELRFDSIWGRKLLTFTRNGSTMATTINRATTMPTTLRTVFTAIPPKGGIRRGARWIANRGQSIKTGADSALLYPARVGTGALARPSRAQLGRYLWSQQLWIRYKRKSGRPSACEPSARSASAPTL